MINVATSLLLVALALNAENAFGTNQYYICKTVDEVFSNGTTGQASTKPDVSQESRGKKGQLRVKGEPGLPGFVDPQDIENVVKEKIREVNRECQGRIGTLEEKLLELNSTVQVNRECQGWIESLEEKLLELNSTAQVTREFQERIETLEEKVLELKSTARKTAQTTAQLTTQPTAQTTAQPTAQSTAQPTVQTTAQPTVQTTAQPTAQPTLQTTAQPTAQPTVETTAQPTAQTTAQQDLFWCDGGEGFYYKTNCYNVILHTTADITYTKGRDLCTAKGGRAANILNAEHQSLVADFLRKKTSSAVFAWLGMSYRNGTLRLSNGNDVTGNVAASITWWKTYPISSSSYEAVGIIVVITTYGLFNFPPTGSLDGVLCEK